jgi:hypothetical protein
VKRLRLIRQVAVPNASGRDGDLVTVTDADARLLLGGDLGVGPAAELVEDLGVDVPVRPVTVRLNRAVSVNGLPHAEGEVVGVSERDARLLVDLGRAEIVSGHVEPRPAVDGGAIVEDAARNRGPLLRPLGRRESAK